MSIASLGNLLKIFNGAKATPEEKQALFKEAAIMTVARATASDMNIKEIEVETVQEIVSRITREEISSADVRMAANSSLFESAPLDKYLSKVGAQLDIEDRLIIVRALAEVILSDKRVSHAEVDFFNMVAAAFSLTPAELAGLIETPAG